MAMLTRCRSHWKLLGLLLVIACAATATYLSLQPRPIRGLVDGERIIDGVIVTGDDLSSADVRTIRKVLDKSSNDTKLHILSINQTAPNNVEVWTGDLRGPLDGGGEIFLLELTDGVWVIIDDGWHRGWVS